MSVLDFGVIINVALDVPAGSGVSRLAELSTWSQIRARVDRVFPKPISYSQCQTDLHYSRQEVLEVHQPRCLPVSSEEEAIDVLWSQYVGTWNVVRFESLNETLSYAYSGLRNQVMNAELRNFGSCTYTRCSFLSTGSHSEGRFGLIILCSSFSLSTIIANALSWWLLFC